MSHCQKIGGTAMDSVEQSLCVTAPDPIAFRPPEKLTQIFRSLCDDAGLIPETWEFLGDSEQDGPYEMHVAASRTERERAYALAFRKYRKKGYTAVETDGPGWCVTPFDTQSQTL